MPPITRSLTLLAIAGLAALPAISQEGPPTEPQDPVARRLGQIERSLERIANLLEAQLRRQDANLALKRIEIAAVESQRLEATRDETRAELLDLEAEQSSIEAQLRQIEATVEEERTRGDSMLLGHLNLQVRHLGEQLERNEERQKEAELRIVELDNRLATQRRERNDWDAVVRQLLAERP